jgi:hypothetical protein
MYHDIYIVIDDNTQEITSNNPNVKILQINNDDCKNNNYTNSTWRFRTEISGWDKAFYYFCENNTYNNVWFIEDDVFISKPYLLYYIDKKYPKYDLLINKMIDTSNDISDNDDWNIRINIAKKYYPDDKIFWSYVCAVRCSNELLNNIKMFKNKNNTLFFHELMIPTIVNKLNLSYKKIIELQNIIYQNEYDDDDIINNPYILYHPIKDYNRQKILRNLIN